MEFKKPLVMILLCAVTTGILAQNHTQPAPNSPAITAIGLVRGKQYDGSRVPGQCIVAIAASRDLYYKLTYNDTILSGGLLKTGPNLVDFHVPELFRTAGIYRYQLITKENNVTTTRPIIIESDIQSLHEPSPIPDQARPGTSRVSMFVGDRLLAVQEKSHQMKLTTKTAGEPMALDYGQYNPVDGRYQSLDRAGFSPLQLLGLAYHQIKKTRDRNKAATEIKIQRSIKFNYSDTPAPGKRSRHRVSIKLTATGLRYGNTISNKIP